METNLTNYQAKLISDLSKEFDKLNPKTEKVGTSRFSINTINECITEEKKFYDTIEKYNNSMVLLLHKQFKEQIKDFEKEYKKLIRLTYGTEYNPTNIQNNINTLFNTTKKFENSGSDECQINFVSEVKRSTDSDTRKYNDGRAFFTLYVSFKLERVKIELKSGKEIVMNKIIGLNFSTRNWLHKTDSYATNRNTLDLLIQECQEVQKSIVRICQ